MIPMIIDSHVNPGIPWNPTGDATTLVTVVVVRPVDVSKAPVTVEKMELVTMFVDTNVAVAVLVTSRDANRSIVESS